MSVSIEEVDLRFEDPEPKFADPEPKARTQWLLGFFGFMVSWTIAITTSLPMLVGWTLTILVVMGVVAVRRLSHRNNLNVWNTKKDRMRRRREACRRLQSRNVPLYNLVLESSSGRSVALSTFDRKALIALHEEILTAMRGSMSPAHAGSIQTISSSSGPIDKLFEGYCRNIIDSA